MTSTAIEHGTPAGYQAHRKAGEDACSACRTAAAEYAREYRKKPEQRRRASTYNSARSRALTRLAKLHPAQFEILLNEELDR